MKTDTIAFRLIAGAALWLGLALVISGLVLAALFEDHVERGFDRRISILLESLVAVAEISPAGELLVTDPPGEPRFRQPYSGWYWQVDNGAQILQRSPSLWDDRLSLGTGAVDRPDRFEIDGPNKRRLRVVARAITLPGSKSTFGFAVGADTAAGMVARRAMGGINRSGGDSGPLRFEPNATHPCGAVGGAGWTRGPAAR
jgi:hypothetical protein